MNRPPKVVSRLIDDAEPWPWGVFVDGELVHRDGNRASARAWADRKRVELEQEQECNKERDSLSR